MTRRQFDKLVERIEARYRGRPGALKHTTAMWVALGLAGIVSWVGLLLVLGAACFVGGIVLEPPAPSGSWPRGFANRLRCHAGWPLPAG